MDKIHVGIRQYFAEVRITGFDSKFIADLIQLGARTLTNSNDFGIRMSPDRSE